MEKVAHFLSSKAPKMGRINPELLVLSLILLFASVLRLYKIGSYMNFLGDEGRDMIAIYEILHGNLTLLGPASSVGGFFLGPIYFYFAAPFIWLSRYDPSGPSIMVALFGVATVFLVYKLGKEFFGVGAGIIASLLYAISPIAIIYSRSSWNPNIVPFFSIATLYLLYKGVQKKKFLFLLLSGICFGILLQLHYLATFIGMVMFLYVLTTSFLGDSQSFVSKVKLWVLSSLSVFAGFVMGFSPFILFEIRHNFLSTSKIFNFIVNSEETGVGATFVSQTWHVFLRMFGGLTSGYPVPGYYNLYSKEVLAAWIIFAAAVGAISTVFFLFTLYKKGLFRKDSLLLLLWLFIPVILFGFYKKEIYDYYLGIVFPLPFLMVGNFISNLWNFKKGLNPIFLKSAALVIFGILIYTNLQRTPIKIGENQQVKQARDAANLVLELSGGKPFNFGLIGGGNSDHAYRYFFKLAGREPVSIENPQKDPKRLTVTDQLLVVCEKPAALCHPLGDPAWEIAGFGRAEIEGQWASSVLTVIKLKHYTGQ